MGSAHEQPTSMQMLPFTKIHLVELAIEMFSANQEITTTAVSSRLLTGMA